MAAVAERLLESATDDIDRARLLASRSKESGAWLHALPLSALGLRLDDDHLSVAVGLRLGTPLCSPHQCQHCGEEVDTTGRHGLSCRRSEGRHHRHAAMNSIIHHASPLHVCLQDWSHQGCCAEMASDLTVFQLCHGGPGSFWCGMPRVLTLLLSRTEASPFILLGLLQRGLSPLRRRST